MGKKLENEEFLRKSRIRDKMTLVFFEYKGAVMAVKYDKLFEELKKRNMKEIELTRQAGFSGNIMTRIRRNEYVSLESIEKICNVLDTKVDDIVTFTK